VLTFKPRGWRGKDAFEISGYVADAAGTVVYEIAGRWNSQLIMRPVGAGSGTLNPDETVRGPNSPSPTPEFILLWRNSEKPLAPFNLTPFAISLNNLPEDTLRPYLPPTDCRLRPDQRAFELGRYEHANALKTDQEEFQRAIRKAREEGREPPHHPRWFSAETDGDTGERVWSPMRIGEDLAYWVEREKAYNQGGKDAWRDVNRIFIDDEE
jgi:oxysterol-binding protein 1